MSIAAIIAATIAKLEAEIQVYFNREEDAPQYLWQQRHQLLLELVRSDGTVGGTNIDEKLNLINNRLENIILLLRPERRLYRNSGDSLWNIITNSPTTVFYMEVENRTGQNLFLQVYNGASPSGAPVYSRTLPSGQVFFFDDDLPLTKGLTVAWSLNEDTYTPPTGPQNTLIQIIYGDN